MPKQRGIPVGGEEENRNALIRRLTRETSLKV